MINRLVRLFIQDCDNVTDPAVREKYGVLSGAVGIVLNPVSYTHLTLPTIA